jgi:hypothetical protein
VVQQAAELEDSDAEGEGQEDSQEQEMREVEAVAPTAPAKPALGKVKEAAVTAAGPPIDLCSDHEEGTAQTSAAPMATSARPSSAKPDGAKRPGLEGEWWWWWWCPQCFSWLLVSELTAEPYMRLVQLTLLQ